MANTEDGYPMKRIVATTVVSTDSAGKPHNPGKFTRDEAELARFGKKQQLRVCDHFSLGSSP